MSSTWRSTWSLTTGGDQDTAVAAVRVRRTTAPRGANDGEGSASESGAHLRHRAMAGYADADRLDGGTLRDWIRRGPVPYVEAVDLGIVLADVLDHVHASGVLHRDVKPSNIGYTNDRQPKLLDFGLALLDQTRDSHHAAQPLTDEETAALLRSGDPEATVTVGERLVGTPLYLAPEALAGGVPQPSFDRWGWRWCYTSNRRAPPVRCRRRGDRADRRKAGGYPTSATTDRPVPSGWPLFCGDALSPSIPRRPENAGACGPD